MKRCKKCGIEKSLDCFSKCKVNKDGRRGMCKDCEKERNKLYREANEEKIKTAKKAWYKANSEKVKANQKSRYKDNQEKAKSRSNEIVKKAIEELRNHIIKAYLKKQGFPPESITPELIETKRILIKTKRLCKTLQN